MTRPRIVALEALDGLAADDPAAKRSRRDLRRLHRAMGTRSLVHRALHEVIALRREATPLRILELGAGDGSLMLGVARILAPAWSSVELTLLDRQALVEGSTIASYADLGWTAVASVADVFEWTEMNGEPANWDIIVANLFLHHFQGAQLATLLGAIASKCNCFLACEPRRAWLALAGSHLVGALGASAVTRQDAVLSVRAGFRDNELTALWPAQGDKWRVEEYSAGLFSHCFYAESRGIS